MGRGGGEPTRREEGEPAVRTRPWTGVGAGGRGRGRVRRTGHTGVENGTRGVRDRRTRGHEQRRGWLQPRSCSSEAPRARERGRRQTGPRCHPRVSGAAGGSCPCATSAASRCGGRTAEASRTGAASTGRTGGGSGAASTASSWRRGGPWGPSPWSCPCCGSSQARRVPRPCAARPGAGRTTTPVAAGRQGPSGTFSGGTSLTTRWTCRASAGLSPGSGGGEIGAPARAASGGGGRTRRGRGPGCSRGAATPTCTGGSRPRGDGGGPGARGGGEGPTRSRLRPPTERGRWPGGDGTSELRGALQGGP